MPSNEENIQNLGDKEAIKKLQDLVKSEQTCMFVTRLSEIPLSSCPMSTQDVDDEGNIWFLSAKSSHKNQHLEADPRIHLFYSNSRNYEYLSVYGRATITSEKDQIEKLWSPIAKAWFQEGKNDPELTVIKVVPEEAYYWDTKNNKLVSMAKILTSVITGKTMDDGVEGELKV